jgi:hypothetical protein
MPCESEAHNQATATVEIPGLAHKPSHSLCAFHSDRFSIGESRL